MSREDDFELDRRARRVAGEKGISYSQALEYCAMQAALPPIGFSGQTAMSDAQLDAAARHCALQDGVSYAEALMRVAGAGPFGPAEFRCSLGGIVSFAGSDSMNYAASSASVMESQWIEIFKAGTHVSSDGQALTFTANDIKAIADGYRPEVREAPLVEGHPPMNAPSYGWVAKLMATPAGQLLMRVKQVEAAFAERVKAGRFKKRSAAFYPLDATGNPTPGQFYLRHVGFLGAHQPALPGMGDIDFSPAR
ncbi:hypothetical protein GPA22_22110 [Aromatoleum toluvorans]|uniref:Uncharacterized protein n=1 Tax=Aromatoleum toluvorans TaxID=92002 RepID=A0ABX1Q7T1_9RHOO|nr:hypothetical protein [Aromatoleum toluvorans]NMG46416.1 hypothetical protein [Aromatoleum toluvorans]